MENEKDVIMELKHDAVPGYRKAFYIVFALGIIYLGIIFLL
ncbi:MAG: hypothetical protein ACUZ8O_06930 [Candidatus Anammoxibacter sp.]